VVGLVKSDAPHSHLVEFGSNWRYHKNGKFVGKMPELAPLRKAFDENERRLSKKSEEKILGFIENKLKG
jgi:hypothetical protein